MITLLPKLNNNAYKETRTNCYNAFEKFVYFFVGVLFLQC